MKRVWTWNIARDHQTFFAEELKNGRLRQGWGYDDRLDLGHLRQRVQQNQALDDKEKEAWNRVSAMIMDWGIHPGDVVLIKNTPEFGWYTLAEVIGGYQFDRTNTPDNDFGHFIRVKILRKINKHSAAIAGDLRAAIDNQRNPIAVAVKRAKEILSLLEARPEVLTAPVPWWDRTHSLMSSVIDKIKEEVVRNLHNREFEDLIKDLLEAEGFENLIMTRGPGERGADIVMSTSVPFFDDLKIVVQAKHHIEGEDNDKQSVNQLRQAFEHYKAIAGLLVTSASKIGPQLENEVAH
jgi:hypothetical protein